MISVAAGNTPSQHGRNMSDASSISFHRDQVSSFMVYVHHSKTYVVILLVR